MLLASFSLVAQTSVAETWAERYQDAEWVSRVRIESVSSLVNPALSQTGVLAIQGYRYHATVVKSWKGGQGGTIKFRVDLSDCHQLLEVDREYVVFGSTTQRGSLQSRRCDNIISVEEAGTLLTLLDQYSQSPRTLGRAKA